MLVQIQVATNAAAAGGWGGGGAAAVARSVLAGNEHRNKNYFLIDLSLFHLFLCNNLFIHMHLFVCIFKHSFTGGSIGEGEGQPLIAPQT